MDLKMIIFVIYPQQGTSLVRPKHGDRPRGYECSGLFWSDGLGLGF